MERDQMLNIIEEKAVFGWDADRILNHLIIIDDLQKLNKDETSDKE
jgi:hypothetical protein